MLQEPSRLLFDKLAHHVAQHCPDRIESLVCGANIVEAVVVEQNLLDNENRHRLAELGPRLHDAKTQRNDLGGQQEVDHLSRVILNQRTDHSQRREPQVFERPRLGGCVEEWIQEKRNMSWRICQQAYQKTINYSRRALPLRNNVRVSLCDATHWRRASALHTLLEAAAVSCDGFNKLYTLMIS